MAEEQKFECPQCHSENIQKYEVAYMSGTSTSSSITAGVGIFGDAGGGVAKTNTSSMTDMAATVAPPQKKGIVKKFMIMGLIFCIVLGGIGSAISHYLETPLFLAGWAIAGYLVYKNNYLWNQNVYPQLLEQWHHSYVCLKCGNRFTL